jgi:hypothetical protein
MYGTPATAGSLSVQVASAAQVSLLAGSPAPSLHSFTLLHVCPSPAKPLLHAHVYWMPPFELGSLSMQSAYGLQLSSLAGSPAPSLHSFTLLQLWPSPEMPALHVHMASPSLCEGSKQVA